MIRISTRMAVAFFTFALGVSVSSFNFSTTPGGLFLHREKEKQQNVLPSVGRTEVTGFALNGVIPPDFAMEQVVRVILQRSIDTPSRPATLLLAAEHIDKSWLPGIENVQFRMLAEWELKPHEKNSVHFFTQPTFEDGRFSIAFARGDRRCSYTGTLWIFRLVGERVEIEYAGTTSQGCGSTSGSLTPARTIAR